MIHIGLFGLGILFMFEGFWLFARGIDDVWFDRFGGSRLFFGFDFNDAAFLTERGVINLSGFLFLEEVDGGDDGNRTADDGDDDAHGDHDDGLHDGFVFVIGDENKDAKTNKDGGEDNLKDWHR